MTTEDDMMIYLLAKARYGEDENTLFEFLRAHRLDHPTLTVGYYVLRAKRFQNWTQADIAARTIVGGRAITRGFISAFLLGTTGGTPETLTSMMRAMGANPVEWYLAYGWLENGDLAAYGMAGGEAWVPIANRLANMREEDKVKSVALVEAVLDIIDRHIAPPDVPAATGATRRLARSPRWYES